ncbi:MAG TPA: SDR family oxidoreductase [Pirellulaceae bacterium]|nr:SDR family oxidoreductase [Pirellulaceae bacterium]
MSESSPLSAAPGAAFASLTGRRAVVTGSSSGIGAAIAVELARAGAAVDVHGNQNLAGLAETAKQVRALGVACRERQADLSRAEGRSSLAHEALAEGVPDFWINAAGADVLTGGAWSEPFENKLERLWRVDVEATVELSRTIGQAMQQAVGEPGQRVIVNIGWDQVAHGMAGDSGQMFGAVKGAVAGFTRSLALSLAPQVRVHLVAPGWIQTRWGEQQASDYWHDRAKRECLLERWGKPEDVAKAVRFLCSPEAGFLNAQEIAVNGGFRPGT